MKSSAIFSVYPVSKTHHKQIENKMGLELDMITTAMIFNSNGRKNILTALSNIKLKTLLVTSEDENGRVLLPILKILALLTRSQTILEVTDSIDFIKIRRVSLIKNCILLTHASINCLYFLFKTYAEISLLELSTKNQVQINNKLDNILYLKTNMWFGLKAGGSIGHVAGVVNELNRRGKSVSYATAEDPIMLDKEVNIMKIKPQRVFGIPYILNNYVFQSVFQRQLEKMIDLSNYSFIYQRLSLANYLGVTLAKKYNLPLVIEYNGSEVWAAKNWGNGVRFSNLAFRAEKITLNNADLIITISDVLKEELKGRGIQENKIINYPNCIDPTVFNPGLYENQRNKLRNSLKIGNEKILVTFVGTFGKWHGAEILAKAIAELSNNKKWGLSNLHFLFVGDGVTKAIVEEIICSSGSSSKCSFVGLVQQIMAPKYLAASDILVSPHVTNQDGSKFFGSPTKLFEYMAMEKPIIASNLEQIGQVLNPSLNITSLPIKSPQDEDKEVALLVRPGSYIDLCLALSFISRNPLWGQKLGENARSLAIRKFTWKQHVDKLYEKIV